MISITTKDTLYLSIPAWHLPGICPEFCKAVDWEWAMPCSVLLQDCGAYTSVFIRYFNQGEVNDSKIFNQMYWDNVG